MTSIYRRTYRLHVGLRLFLLAGGLGFLIVPVMLALNWKNEQSGPLEAFFGAVLVLFGVFCIGEALVSRRVTSPAAIEQVDFLYRATAPWSEIDRIEVNAYGIANLMLKHAAASGCLPIVWYCRLFGFDQMISVSGFGTGPEHDELVADIARFAPHLRDRKKTNWTDIFQQLQWYAVRVLLQGPTKSDNAQALEDVREELLSRPYLENPEVIWGDDGDGLVIRVEVELGSAGADAAAAFIQDEVFEAACAVLPIDVEGSVKILGSEAVQGGQQAKEGNRMKMTGMSECDGLKGMRVRVYLIDPWDLVTAVGTGPLQAMVLQVGGDSWSPEARSLLLRLAVPFEYGGVVCEYVIASSRYRHDDLAGIAGGSSVVCSFTRISGEQATSDEAFDLTNWRGGLAWLGTLTSD